MVSKAWMENFEDFPSLIQWQEQDEGHECGVAQEHTKQCAPEHGMWTANVGIWKLRYSKSHNSAECKEKWPSVVFKNIGIVFISEILLPFTLNIININV